MSGAAVCRLDAAEVTTLLSADWNPATRTRPLRSPGDRGEFLLGGEWTRPRISAAR